MIVVTHNSFAHLHRLKVVFVIFCGCACIKCHCCSVWLYINDPNMRWLEPHISWVATRKDVELENFIKCTSCGSFPWSRSPTWHVVASSTRTLLIFYMHMSMCVGGKMKWFFRLNTRMAILQWPSQNARFNDAVPLHNRMWYLDIIQHWNWTPHPCVYPQEI